MGRKGMCIVRRYYYYFFPGGLNTSSLRPPGRMASGLLPEKGCCRQLSRGPSLLCIFEDYANGLKM